MSGKLLKVELKGFDEMKRKLDYLYEIDRKQHRKFKNGIKKAAKPYIKYMKAELSGVGYKRQVTKTNRSGKTVRFTKGALKRSIGYIPSRSQKSLTGYIGARSGKRSGKTYDGYYASIVNYGKGPGESRAQGFADRAYAKGKNEVQAALEKEVKKILENSLLKLATMK